MEVFELTLQAFFSEMKKWNDAMYSQFIKGTLTTEKEENGKLELISLMSKFCTEKNVKTVSLHYTDPSEYDVNTQIIERYEILTKNKVVIYVQQLNRFKNKYKYTLFFKNGNWLIDKKEWFMKSKNKWTKCDL